MHQYKTLKCLSMILSPLDALFKALCSNDRNWISICLTSYGILGLPRWHSGNEPTCEYRRWKRHRRYGFNPWVGKISWKKWQPTPVFLPGESHEQRSLPIHGTEKEFDMTELLSTCICITDSLCCIPETNTTL